MLTRRENSSSAPVGPQPVVSVFSKLFCASSKTAPGPMMICVYTTSITAVTGGPFLQFRHEICQNYILELLGEKKVPNF